jgi:SAM-dependent methyltransferase
MDIASHWNQLHNEARFRPIYPSDHVVRFMIANHPSLEAETLPRFLDIGLGAGRHIKLATDLGFAAFGVDISIAGLTHAHQRLAELRSAPNFALASYQSLPFSDKSFQFVLSHGVFYYGTAENMKRGIAEAHRVLLPQGKLFAVLRSVHDYRFAKGEAVGHNTFRLTIRETNECGTVQHFLAAEDITEYFHLFRTVAFEKTETTTAGRTQLHSDWLIMAEK